MTPAGRMMSDAPTAYALALGFDLVTDAAQRTRLAGRLAELVRERRLPHRAPASSARRSSPTR